MLEIVIILETEPENAVEGSMAEQYEARQNERMRGEEPSGGGQTKRDTFMMKNIVQESPGSLIQQVSRHSHIRKEKNERVKPHGQTGMQKRNTVGGSQEHNKLFEAQNGFHCSLFRS